MSVTCQVKNYKALRKQLEDMKKAPEQVIDRTVSDIVKRGPAWVAKGVSQRYNISSREVTSGKIGTLKFKGDKIKRLQLVYGGRILTPVHFGMRPKEPKNGSYTLKYKVMRDGEGFKQQVKKLSKKQRAALGKNFTREGSRNSPQSPWMLQHTGAKSEDKVQYIPFQRRSQPGKLSFVQKTVALPQMVTEGENGPMHPEVEKSFNENLEKRFNHYVQRYMGK